MSSMLIPGLNQLVEPEIVKVEVFEALLAEFSNEVLQYVAERDPAKAARLAETLGNESELMVMMMQAFVLRIQTHERKFNAKIKQMLAWWAEGTNLDARAADAGLERRVVSAGDPNAFPPVAAVMESDDDLRLRYYLAPHAPAAGSRLQYRREALTLGERATVKVEAPAEGQVVMTYTFSTDSFAAQVKDANARFTAPGEVDVTVLSRQGDGTPSAELLAATVAHFERDDVCPETDKVRVRAAEIIRYKIRAIAYINPGPDTGLTETAGVAAMQAYAAAKHRLEGYVDPDWINSGLIVAGAERVERLEPLAPIVCTAGQAPYCEEVEIEVRTL